MLRKQDCESTILESAEKEFDMPAHWSRTYPRNFFEYNLSDFGLPSAAEILEDVNKIVNEIGGVRGWRAKGKESNVHKGFSLVYNPEIEMTAFGTLGDYRLTQNFSRSVNVGGIDTLRNSYHDSYAFSEVHPVVKKHLRILNHLNMQLTRSRCAFIYTDKKEEYELRAHKDEFPYQNLRINIPLQTCPEFVMEIRDQDEYGNSLNMIKHLEVGKLYVWNTRIPHSVYAAEKPSSDLPRIHLVLGLMPWININGDEITKSEFFGIHPFKLLEDGLVFKRA